MYVVEDGRAQELAFDPAMFDYSRAGVKPSELPPTMGFGGFRVFFHTDWVRDAAVFQGASYFRAVDGDLQFGMSRHMAGSSWRYYVRIAAMRKRKGDG